MQMIWGVMTGFLRDDKQEVGRVLRWRHISLWLQNIDEEGESPEAEQDVSVNISENHFLINDGVTMEGEDSVGVKHEGLVVQHTVCVLYFSVWETIIDSSSVFSSYWVTQ